MNQREANRLVLEAARRLQERAGLLWFTAIMLYDDLQAQPEGETPSISAVIRATYYLRQDRHIHKVRPGNFHYHPEQHRFRLAGFKAEAKEED